MKSILRTLCAALLVAVPAHADEAPVEAPKPSPAKMAEVLTPNEYDVIIGKADAPLTLVEYSSLSCSHCASFHGTVLPMIKKELIEPGKLQFINRDFPLNAPALKGAMLVQCAPKDKQAKFHEVLFKLQAKWAFTPSYESALKKIAKVGGVDENAFDACMEDKALEERVLKVRQEAGEHLNIQGTPSFFLDGEAFAVKGGAEDFIQALKDKLSTNDE